MLEEKLDYLGPVGVSIPRDKLDSPPKTPVEDNTRKTRSIVDLDVV